MKDFKQWCKIICVISVVAGVLLSFLPKSGLDKAFKCLICVLTVFTFIYPFSADIDTFKSAFSIYTKEQPASDELHKQNSYVVIDCAEDLLEKQIDTIIKKINNDTESEVVISQQDTVVFVEKITITGAVSDDEINKITALIADKVGGDAKIEFVR